MSLTKPKFPYAIDLMPFIDARLYGIKADGVTDDSVAFLDLCTNAPAGSKILFPKGTIKILTATTVNITTDNLTFVGEGWDTIIDATASLGFTLYVQSRRFTIRDMQIIKQIPDDAHPIAGNQPPIYFTGSDNDCFDGLVDHVKVLGGSSCIKINSLAGGDPFAGTAPKRITIQNSEFYGSTAATLREGGVIEGSYFNGEIKVIGNRCYDGRGASSINFLGCERGEIVGNFIYNNSYAGIEIENCVGKVSVTGNTIEDCNTGIWVDDASSVTVTGNTIVNSKKWYAYPDQSKGIAISSSSLAAPYDQYFTDAVTVVGNTIANVELGIQIIVNVENDAAAAVKRTLIAANNLVDCVYGVYFFDALGSGNVTDVTVSGNLISYGNNIFAAITQYYQAGIGINIDIQSKKLSILGNTIVGFYTGLRNRTNAMTNLTIKHNVFRGNQINDILFGTTAPTWLPDNTYEDNAERVSAVPSTGTWIFGEEVYLITPTAGNYAGHKCMASGTFGTYAEGLTATTDGTTSVVLSGATAVLKLGDWIVINGNTRQIQRISADNITLTVSLAIAAGGPFAITYSSPTFKGRDLIEA